MNENLTLGCILLFNAQTVTCWLSFQSKQSTARGASVWDQDRMQLTGVPHSLRF